MATAAVRMLGEDRADAANSYGPSIEDRRKVVLHSAGKHRGTVHQSKSSLVTTPPRGFQLGSVKFGVRVAAQAFGRDRVRHIKNALENNPLGWNDNRHLTNHRPAAW